MNYPLFIARKIYNGGDKTRKVSKPAIRIATVGVAIGLAVMIVSVCVVLGFKHTIRDKVVGFGSHITVADFLTLQSSEQYPIQVSDSLIKVLKAVPGVRHGRLQNNCRQTQSENRTAYLRLLHQQARCTHTKVHDSRHLCHEHEAV